MLALTIVRDHYIGRLSTPARDQGLTAALVQVFQTVELCYALACVTLSASRSFTDMFYSGFGMTHAHFHDVGESYHLSNVNRKGTPGLSVTSSRSTAKSRPATIVSASCSNTAGQNEGPLTFAGMMQGSSFDGHLKLRPEKYLAAHASARHSPTIFRNRDRAMGPCEEEDEDDMVIYRQTDFSMHHDEAAILETLPERPR